MNLMIIGIEIIVMLAFAIFVLMDLNMNSSIDGIYQSPLSKSEVRKRSIRIFVLQLAVAFIVMGMATIKFFAAFEVIVTFVIIADALMDSSKDMKISSRIKISKLVGLAAFIYSKFLLFMLVRSLMYRLMSFQYIITLFILTEAFGIYMVVSHIFLAGEKLHYIKNDEREGFDLNFLFCDRSIRTYLYMGIAGVLFEFIGFPLSRMGIPYLSEVMRILNSLLMLIFMVVCFIRIKKWSYIKGVMLIGLLGAAAEVVSRVCFESILRNWGLGYFTNRTFMISARVGDLLLIGLPLALILSKVSVGVIKFLSWLTAGFGIIYMFFDIFHASDLLFNTFPVIQFLLLTLLAVAAYINRKQGSVISEGYMESV